MALFVAGYAFMQEYVMPRQPKVNGGKKKQKRKWVLLNRLNIVFPIRMFLH